MQETTSSTEYPDASGSQNSQSSEESGHQTRVAADQQCVPVEGEIKDQLSGRLKAAKKGVYVAKYRGVEARRRKRLTGYSSHSSNVKSSANLERGAPEDPEFPRPDRFSTIVSHITRDLGQLADRLRDLGQLADDCKSMLPAPKKPVTGWLNMSDECADVCAKWNRVTTSWIIQVALIVVLINWREIWLNKSANAPKISAEVKLDS